MPNEESELRYTERVILGEKLKYVAYIKLRPEGVTSGWPRVKSLRVLAMNKEEAKQLALDEWSHLLKHYYDPTTIRVSRGRRRM